MMVAERDTIVATLLQSLGSCGELIEAGDYSDSEQSIAALVNLLNSTSNAIIREETEFEESEGTAFEILTQIHRYVALPTLKQEVIDALAFEFPKAVAKFACVSGRCLKVSKDIFHLFVERCSGRDMLSILCEAIGSATAQFMIPGYFIPLLDGLTKVFIIIQRRQYEHAKATVPVILKVLKVLCSKEDEDTDYDNTDYEELFHKASQIACSIRSIGVKLEGEVKQKLQALLGLYVLQIMALLSVKMTSDTPIYLSIVSELLDLLRQCELSYIGLVTGSEVDIISKLVLGDESEDIMNCFSEVKLGAAFVVIWCWKNSEVAELANADLAVVIMELQRNWARRWEAISMLKCIFACHSLIWELKQHGIRFLLCILDGNASHLDNDHTNDSIDISTLYTSLQAIEMVIMYAPDPGLRKKAFSALKKVLGDIPTSVRLDVLRALVINADASSMIGILLDCVKEEMCIEKIKASSLDKALLNSEAGQGLSFWNPSVLELVEFVLRPPKGGPPSLPEYSDAVNILISYSPHSSFIFVLLLRYIHPAFTIKGHFFVLSALNLFRYILITESTGKSNHTGILWKDKLQKAYKEWLLPLRTLLTGTTVEYHRDCDLASDVTCALNPVELVLYRCIELVEEELKHL